ncbi:hypothetical protein HD596_005951 [Nonomuraea jabiensis]|uniref:Transcription regulator AsnC/Lrp ligand binding domain-containing protein n=1 Tax=Nonomuraea jabiensis TaxID=882448 RepID=A0A7W9G8L5_9ACTN|nr:hypothetical protein [Nonomuraea jabiensis]
MTTRTVGATAASGVAPATMPTSSSSSDPANADTGSAGASHQDRPAWTTSRPRAIPSGKIPSPAEKGVIRGYRAVIDPAAVGRSFEVLVDLTLDAQDAETVERFEQTLARAAEVIELRRLFGSPDYFVRVAVADLAAYETFLSTYVMTIPRIRNVTSHFTMKNVKPAP